MMDLARFLSFVLTEGKLKKALLKCISTDTACLHIKRCLGRFFLKQCPQLNIRYTVIWFCLYVSVVFRQTYPSSLNRSVLQHFQEGLPGHGRCRHLHMFEWGEDIKLVQGLAAAASWPVPINKQVLHLGGPFCRAGGTRFPRQAEIVSSCEQVNIL